MILRSTGCAARCATQVLNVPVRQGYGLTETCAGSVIQPWSDNTTGASVVTGGLVTGGWWVMVPWWVIHKW